MIFYISPDQAPVETLDPNQAFLLIKSDLYEKSGRNGYTSNILDAGWFTEEFSNKISSTDEYRNSVSLKSELLKKGVNVTKMKLWQKRLDRLIQCGE